ncbi:MAG: paraquat-inducible protein A [Desulfobacteraceae bacterium]|nr:paraquat-inducible protein A [Desulfobacteraceae bacterium]
MDLDAYVACPECDLLHRRQTLPSGGVAKCTRCGAALYRSPRNSLDRTLAMAATGVILLIIANCYPFLSLNVEGQFRETILITGIVELYRQGMPLVATLVLLCGIVFPFIELAGLVYLLLPLKFDHRPWRMLTVFLVIRAVGPWGMTEVYLLGILIAIIKLTSMADIITGAAFYAFALLSFVVAAAAASLNADSIWQRLTVRQ